MNLLVEMNDNDHGKPSCEKIGSNSMIACFSVAQHKNISTLGEGGMIVTNDKKFYENAQGLRSDCPRVIRKKRNIMQI